MPAPAHREGAHERGAAGQLAKRGYPDDVSGRVLNRLADVGLIDDVEFAEQWVRSRRVNAGKGKRALAAELRTKGVDDDVVTAEPRASRRTERERAEHLVRDRLRREKLGDDDHPKVARRLVGMLARRGYSQTTALDVVKGELASERERRRVKSPSSPPPFGCPSCSWCGSCLFPASARPAPPVVDEVVEPASVARLWVTPDRPCVVVAAASTSAWFDATASASSSWVFAVVPITDCGFRDS